MKKIVSIFLTLVMLITLSQTVIVGAVGLLTETKVEILEDSTEELVIIESNEEISDLTLYVAAYNDDTMIKVVSQEIDLHVGRNEFEIEPMCETDICKYVKIFVWDKNHMPYAEKVVILNPTIVVEYAYADYSDNTVKVNVSVINNPGIASLKLNVSYDSELKLTNIEFNEDFGAYVTAPEPYANPQPISLISPLSDIYAEGTLATLTFDISNISEGREYVDVFVTCDDENTFNGAFEEVVFNEISGKIVFDTTALIQGFNEDENISLMSVENPFTLTITNGVTMPGETVKVNVEVANNPGISSLKVDIAYDEVLTLQDVKLSTAFGPYVTTPEPYGNPQSISLISPLSEIAANGTLATMTFLVSENAEDGYVADITASFDEDNIFDSEFNLIDLNIVNGKVNIFDGIPGDINGDGKVNNQDAILLFRHVAGWNVMVIEKALDVTGDSKVNNQDAILLFRYIAGWDVEIGAGKVCVHELTETAEKAATCTEDGNIQYWYCSKCDKCFKDEKAKEIVKTEDTVIVATGHDIVVVPAVAPTYEATGLTEGKKCSNCDYVEVKQEIVPVLQKTEHNIIYHLTDNDSYLESVKGTIENVNPARFFEHEEIILKDASVDGYNFEGWYDGTGSNANRITKIPKNTTEDVVLYARWEISKNSTYTVHFVSDGAAFNVPYNESYVSSITKPMNEKLVIPDGEMYGYVFLCWTDSRGNIIESIEPGSRGDITLSAHWTSMRNQTRPVKVLGTPVVIEDEKDDVIYFIYEIGDIVNVPLEVIEDFGNVDKLDRESRTITTKAITSSTAETIAEVVSNATTNSSLVTLSDEWTEGVSASKEQSSGVSQQAVEIVTQRVAEGNQWNISSSNGGSTAYTINSGSSQSESHKSTTASIESENIYDKDYKEHVDSSDVKTGSNSKASTEKRQDFNIGVDVGYSTEISAEVTVAPGVDVGGSVGTEFGINAGYSNGRTTYDEEGKYEDKANAKYNRTENLDIKETNKTTSVGTEDYKESHSYTDISNSETANWNSTEGYSKSKNVSNDTTVSTAISQAIGEKFGYYSTKDHTNGQSTTTSTIDSSENKREYASTVEYSVEDKTETMTASKIYKDVPGYHRLVEGGTIHVFGVVGYDIANNAYFTYTYNILDSKTTPFYDYSNSDPNYGDRENGVLPFEIPYAVNRYVASMVARTDGLEIDTETGVITDYYGTAENVLIPNYISVDNGDGTRSAVKVTAISANAFSGKPVKTVMLSEYITEIPDGAFKTCTDIETVIAPSVTSIGKEAFSGCVSLKKFSVSSVVTSIGENAFNGVPEIEVYAATPEIVKIVSECGASKISVYLADMVGELRDCIIVTKDATTYFAFYGAGRTFDNVNIVSKAVETTIINRATFNSDNGISLDIYSKNVTLSNVVVNAEGVALLLRSDTTAVTLDKNSTLSSTTGNTLVTKEVSFTKIYGVASKLTVAGKMLVCENTGFNGKELVNASEGISSIAANEYNNIISEKEIVFETNGGSAITNQTLSCGEKIRKPQDPVKNRYKFLGWYADSGLTVAWNFDTPVTENITLYAKWKLNEFTVTFDASGGFCSTTSKTVYSGEKIGSLPTPVRAHYTFLGWYTSAGVQYTADTTYNENINITLIAKWQINEYTVTFHGNGGYTSTTTQKVVAWGKATPPSAWRDYYNHTGWYTNATCTSWWDANSQITGNIDLYAGWTLKDVSGWVKASEIPSGAQEVESKYTYSETFKTTSTSYPLSGWTKYDETTSYGKWGSWSSWSDTKRTESDTRDVETRTRYNYYRYASSYNASTGSKTKTSSCTNKYTYKIGDKLSATNTGNGGYKLWHDSNGDYDADGSNYHSVWKCDTFETTQYRYRDRSKTVTYYYEKTENKESSGYPNSSGGTVSNVQRWVRYRAK